MVGDGVLVRAIGQTRRMRMWLGPSLWWLVAGSRSNGGCTRPSTLVGRYLGTYSTYSTVPGYLRYVTGFGTRSFTPR